MITNIIVFYNNCSNYNPNSKTHFPPYYFCKLCSKELCFKCSLSHFANNINDGKHNEESIISKESILYDNQKLLEELNSTKKEIISFINSQSKEIKKEYEKLYEEKNKIIKKFELFREWYENTLISLANEEKKINIFIEKNISTNIKNYKLHNYNTFIELTNDEKNLKHLGYLISDFFISLKQCLNKIKNDFKEEKNKFIQKIITSLNKLVQNRIINNKINENKLLGFKRFKKINGNKNDNDNENIDFCETTSNIDFNEDYKDIDSFNINDYFSESNNEISDFKENEIKQDEIKIEMNGNNSSKDNRIINNQNDYYINKYVSGKNRYVYPKLKCVYCNEKIGFMQYEIHVMYTDIKHFPNNLKEDIKSILYNIKYVILNMDKNMKMNNYINNTYKKLKKDYFDKLWFKVFDKLINNYFDIISNRENFIN